MIFPTGGDNNDDVLSFDKNNNKWMVVDWLKEYGSEAMTRNHAWLQIFPITVINEKDIYTYSANAEKLLKISADNKITGGYLEINIPYDHECIYLNELSAKGKNFVEDNVTDLKTYIKMVELF